MLPSLPRLLAPPLVLLAPPLVLLVDGLSFCFSEKNGSHQKLQHPLSTFPSTVLQPPLVVWKSMLLDTLPLAPTDPRCLCP